MQRLMYFSKVPSLLVFMGSKSAGKSILDSHFGQHGSFVFVMRFDQQLKHARPLQVSHMLSLMDDLLTPLAPKENLGIGKF